MDLSIIIPTYNEQTNLVKITERIAAALAAYAYTYEIWFIDDSDDNTPQILQQLALQYPDVHFLHRNNMRGLGSAVVEGFKHAQGEYIIVMDADLQHPPELIPNILQTLTAGEDIVIPSRFIPGGSDGGLNPIRKLVSWVARSLGQVAIKRFRTISDCTSGFFGLRRQVIAGIHLNPSSWKILMEIIVKGDYLSIKEIPYTFEARNAGHSNMDIHEQWNYIKHIIKLVSGSPSDRRFFVFCLIGFMGLIVNLVVFDILLDSKLFYPVTASFIASFAGMINNFIWHDTITWREHRHPILWMRLAKFSQFLLVSMVGILITASFVKLSAFFGWKYIFGQLVGIAIAMFWNYFANHLWTWRAKPAERRMH
jgi:dolichol-phosphate mannosyltransferase